jgi:hypothetical protein
MSPSQSPGLLRLAAAVLINIAAVAAVFAWLHMRELGQICGTLELGHCPACWISGSALAAALMAALAAEVLERATPRPARA